MSRETRRRDARASTATLARIAASSGGRARASGTANRTAAPTRREAREDALVRYGYALQHDGR